jgi:hypothetical protein
LARELIAWIKVQVTLRLVEQDIAALRELSPAHLALAKSHDVSVLQTIQLRHGNAVAFSGRFGDCWPNGMPCGSQLG